MRTRALASLGAAAVGLAAAAPAAPAAKPPPKVHQLVVFRDGSDRQGTVKASAVHVHVGGRKCTVGAATALAALVRSKPPKLRLHDYGSCSSHARDAAGLFVRAIGPDANKGQDGWVYKVGHRAATAGAADPAGPFGNGRLKNGSRVTWFYCHMNATNHSCQRTLDLATKSPAPGQLRVHVTAYDDRGKGKPSTGATVHAGALTATTDLHGDATFALPPGKVSVFAEKSGAIRSFTTKASVG